MSSITVTPNLQTKSVSSSTSAQIITPDSGYCRLRQVSVSAFSGRTVQENYYTILKNELNYVYNDYIDYPYTYQGRITEISTFPSNRKFFVTNISFTGASGTNMFSLLDGLTIQQIFSSSQWNAFGSSTGLVSNASTGSTVVSSSVYINCYLSEGDGVLGINLFFGFKSDLYSYFNNTQGTTEFSINTWCF